ncbi:MAG: UDP-N-acetylglucosamine 2-epimerase (non-hydrolyzing) [Bacteroidia bacterium]|nr:UDP-N-acetylglucosamine 2-epimerase (non-hydrolyzing) [Bacteroidia bacterium]
MSQPFKIISVVGARPQFIKLAPFTRAIAHHNSTHPLQVIHQTIHTGQHYDAKMSDVFFDDLGIPYPEFNLAVGSGSHAEQTGKMLIGIEKVLLEEKPDMVVIFGDTNSTAAAALAAVKLHIPLAHIEAGLRSFNRAMPEEINRIVSDHISNILLAPTGTAMENLEREGLSKISVLTGDIMYDTVLHNRKIAEEKSTILADMGLKPGEYAIATLHRAENTSDATLLKGILDTLNQVADNRIPVVFPIHPRVFHLLPKILPDWKASPNLKICDPVGYLEMLQLVGNARLALTDSGGLQKEAFFLDCPCITLRTETEWVETVEGGGNIITGPEPEKIMNALDYWWEKTASGKLNFQDTVRKYFGGGDSGEIILSAILPQS